MPENEAQIRPAAERDLPAIRQIYNYYVVNSSATFDTEEQTDQQSKDWFKHHQSSGLPVLVCEIDGQVAGWASLSFYHSRCAYRQTVESSIYIGPGYVSRGLGRQLLKHLLARAGENRYHCVVVLVCSENEASLKLIDSFGFRRVGSLQEVGRKFDRWLDVTIAQKML